MIPWKILIVDDEEGIHGITRMIFRDYEFEKRPIELISAMSSSEAAIQLEKNPDIALILLDVVMETENAGLQLVETIRHQMDNKDVRIILRTGHPGYAPEAQVIIDYDINDYLSKAELSASRLLTSVIVALRSYRDIKNAREQEPVDLKADSLPADDLLPAVSERLQQHLIPALKQSQRLHKLELNPVAADLAKEVFAHQQRLKYLLDLSEAKLPKPSKPQAISLQELMDKVLRIYLPQSRREGWIIDYRLTETVLQGVHKDPEYLELLMISTIELALLQAKGADLKITLSKQESLFLIEVEQDEGQPVFCHSAWAEKLRQNLQYLTKQLGGRFNELDEGGRLCCRIPL